MTSIIYKIIWCLIHVIMYSIDLISSIYLEFKLKLKELINKSNKHSIKFDIEYLNSSINKFKKLPNHVVIILNEDTFNFNILSNLINWCSEAGVKFISFYDCEDTFEHEYNQLRIYIEDKLSKLRPDENETNEFKTQFSLNLLRPKHGKKEVASLCQQFGYATRVDNLKSSDLTIELIDKKLKESLNNLPDPDVALYFGTICRTFGLLPWQIRLTEFYSLGKQKHVNVEKFTDILKVYSKSEQRFGK